MWMRPPLIIYNKISMECVYASRCRSEWSGGMGELPIIDIQLGYKVIIWMAVTSTCAYNEMNV